jgi:hypothetical protein
VPDHSGPRPDPALVGQLVEQYERLRCGVLAGRADGWRVGLGVLCGKGLAAWMHAVSAAAPAPTSPGTATAQEPSPPTAPPGSLTGEVVTVLAQMALAHT